MPELAGLEGAAETRMDDMTDELPDRDAALRVALRHRLLSMDIRDKYGFETACVVVAEHMAGGDPVATQTILDQIGVR